MITCYNFLQPSSTAIWFGHAWIHFINNSWKAFSILSDRLLMDRFCVCIVRGVSEVHWRRIFSVTGLGEFDNCCLGLENDFPFPLSGLLIFSISIFVHESSLWVAFSFCMPGHSCSWKFFGEDSMVKRVFHVVVVSYVSACILNDEFQVRFIFMLILRNCVLLMLGYFLSVCCSFSLQIAWSNAVLFGMEMDKFREAFMKKFNYMRNRVREYNSGVWCSSGDIEIP